MLNSALLSTPLGRFTLLADNAGLCGVLFPGEEENRPAQSLSDISTHPLLMETGRQLLAYLEGRLRTFDLPLSVHGTSFQQTVWAQLCSIPYGHTMTYGQLAERIGNRNKARAVG
ncbi:MAG: 6-O-methylguanine DNA methyltransferase, partial [Desulfobulbus sp.]|nr:6-O-methylguanine DNA methyltransferase [Desulfobulbus sp.]